MSESSVESQSTGRPTLFASSQVLGVVALVAVAAAAFALVTWMVQQNRQADAVAAFCASSADTIEKAATTVASASASSTGLSYDSVSWLESRLADVAQSAPTTSLRNAAQVMTDFYANLARNAGSGSQEVKTADFKAAAMEWHVACSNAVPES